MTQLAASFCSLINGGNYYEPHVVKQIQNENGNVTENKDPVLVRHTISKETSDIIKDYMLGVVEEGTASDLLAQEGWYYEQYQQLIDSVALIQKRYHTGTVYLIEII